MDSVTISDVLLFSGIIGLAGLVALLTSVTGGISYKKTRRIPPYKR